MKSMNPTELEITCFWINHLNNPCGRNDAERLDSLLRYVELASKEPERFSNPDYISALETALKSARKQIEIYKKNLQFYQ